MRRKTFIRFTQRFVFNRLVVYAVEHFIPPCVHVSCTALLVERMAGDESLASVVGWCRVSVQNAGQEPQAAQKNESEYVAMHLGALP